MARIQILELPEGASDDRPPFALVVDQANYDSLSSLSAALEGWENLKGQLGARAVLVFEETVDIPANEIPVGPLLRADTGIDSNIQAGLSYIGARYSDPSAAEQRIELARQALAADGYFSLDEIGDDIAPRITEHLSHQRQQMRDFAGKICDALGLDSNPAIDLIAAARSIRKQRDQSHTNLEAVGQLHQRVEHRGQTICGHCSAWDGPEYDSTDNAPIGWPCETVKAATDYVDEHVAGEPA